MHELFENYDFEACKGKLCEMMASVGKDIVFKKFEKNIKKSALSILFEVYSSIFCSIKVSEAEKFTGMSSDETFALIERAAKEAEICSSFDKKSGEIKFCKDSATKDRKQVYQ